MTKILTNPQEHEVERNTEEIDIDFLLSDVMIKAESLKNRKIFNYANYLEKQLLKIKNRQATLDLGVPLK
ncbi:MAG: hypothetical protein IKF11_10155 [Methanobrevibacter sp.]|nr:hypothetical protein [Methanobrevibacter sp.]